MTFKERILANRNDVSDTLCAMDAVVSKYNFWLKTVESYVISYWTIPEGEQGMVQRRINFLAKNELATVFAWIHFLSGIETLSETQEDYLKKMGLIGYEKSLARFRKEEYKDLSNCILHLTIQLAHYEKKFIKNNEYDRAFYNTEYAINIMEELIYAFSKDFELSDEKKLKIIQFQIEQKKYIYDSFQSDKRPEVEYYDC